MLEFYGHCAFRWTSTAGIRVLIDPFQNDLPRANWFEAPFPAVDAELVVITHDHFDHNAWESLSPYATVLRGPGRFAVDDVVAEGVRDVHSRYQAPRLKRNTMFNLEIDGVRYCHIGDNRAEMPDAVVEALGRIDVLMVTVDDSCHLLSYPEVDQVIERLQPRIVIPMHYFHAGVTTVESGLEACEGWLATQPLVNRLAASQVSLTATELPAKREVWVMELSLASTQVASDEVVATD
ncbi:MAG TPA: MBL fold metallo-hydrolase [Dehalococcoidia bacterium]|nr:MBL fold metallo-hydrolase [Dehalococcoidia bacterium]